jgi:hypothetical protein
VRLRAALTLTIAATVVVGGATLALRAYLGRAVAGVVAWAFLNAMRPLESCRRARWFSGFLDQRMRIPRLRFSQA